MRIGVNSGSLDALERGPAMRKVQVKLLDDGTFVKSDPVEERRTRARGAGGAHGGQGARILWLGRRPRFLQLQGLAEKLERADRRGRLSQLLQQSRTCRCTWASPRQARSSPARSSRRIGFAPAAGGWHRRHDPCLAERRAGGRDSRRLRDPALAGPAPARRHLRLVPLMWSRRDRRDHDRQRGGEAADARCRRRSRSR